MKKYYRTTKGAQTLRGVSVPAFDFVEIDTNLSRLRYLNRHSKKPYKLADDSTHVQLNRTELKNTAAILENPKKWRRVLKPSNERTPPDE